MQTHIDCIVVYMQENRNTLSKTCIKTQNGFLSESACDGLNQAREMTRFQGCCFFSNWKKVQGEFVKDPLQKAENIHECSCSLCKRKTLSYTCLKEQD